MSDEDREVASALLSTLAVTEDWFLATASTADALGLHHSQVMNLRNILVPAGVLRRVRGWSAWRMFVIA
jgi:hypothetical protein